MNTDTRQTGIGVAGIVTVTAVGVSQGLNGTLTTTAVVSIVALVSPQVLDSLPLTARGDG